MLDSNHVSLTTTTYEFAEDVITVAESSDLQVVLLNADKSIDVEARSTQKLKLIGKTEKGSIIKASTLDDAVEAADPST